MQKIERERKMRMIYAEEKNTMKAFTELDFGEAQGASSNLADDELARRLREWAK